MLGHIYRLRTYDMTHTQNMITSPKRYKNHKKTEVHLQNVLICVPSIPPPYLCRPINIIRDDGNE